MSRSRTYSRACRREKQTERIQWRNIDVKTPDQTLIYIENFDTDTRFCQKQAIKALDAYYIDIMGKDWKLIFPDIQDLKTYYVNLVELINSNLFSLDLGPFN